MSASDLLSISIAAALLSGAGFLGIADMQTPASSHLPFTLHFPADLEADQVANWFRSLAGTLHRDNWQPFGAPTSVLEILATELGIFHRLRVPKEHAGFIVPQLRTLVPGINVTPDEDQSEPIEWSAALELGMSHPGHTLDIPNASTLTHSVLGALQGVKRGEALLIQYVLSPTVREKLPATASEVRTINSTYAARLLSGVPNANKDEIADRRAKLAEPNFLGVIRVAAKASETARARAMVNNVRKVFSSTGNRDNRLRRRIFLSSKRVGKRVNNASSPTLFPGQYSTSELVGLTGWPIGNPHVAGLPQGRTRQLAATGSIPRRGIVVAKSNFDGSNRPLAIEPVLMTQHMHVVGPTGSGKTVFAENVIYQTMMANRGVILIESKGDLYNGVLNIVPKHRIKDVVLVDVTDTDYPPAFNILQGNPYAVAAEIQRLFDHLYPADVRGIRVRQGFYHLILTLLMSRNAPAPMTFADIGPLILPRADQMDFSDRLIRGVSHVEELASWWQEITNLPRAHRDNYFKPISDRIWQLNNRRSIRNIIGQSVNTIDLYDIIRRRKILLVNTGRAMEGTDTAGLVASLVLNAVWSAVQRGAADPNNPTMLFLDEFQDFTGLPIAPQDWWAQARSLGLSVTVLHQFIGQLNKELQEATRNNNRSTVVFQTSADEAGYFAKQFGRSVTADDFMNQRRFEVIMRLATADGVSSPVTGITLPPVEPTGFAEQIRELSRARYGRPVADVEAEIKARHSKLEPKASKAKRKFGGKPWNE